MLTRCPPVPQGSATGATSSLSPEWTRSRWSTSQRGSASPSWGFVELLRYSAVIVNKIRNFLLLLSEMVRF